MRIRTLWRRITAIVLAAIVGMFCIPTAALAAESIDTGRESSLSVYFGENGTGFPGVNLSIHHVADISADGIYTLTENFAGYPVSLEDLDNSGWRALAQTLAAYTVRDGLNPLQTKKTDQDGRSRFPKLTTGLYLVIVEPYTAENTVYIPEPMLISLPGLTGEGGWDYDVEAVCKFNREETPAGPVSRKVQKIWKDDGSEENRPEEIVIQLLENGTVVDTVTLGKENNWEYTWENLDSSSRWQVTEADVSDGYTVTISQEGTVFIITNTRPYEPPPKLPQTGMLWWPVPTLACGGLLLIAVGLIVRHRQGGANEKEK